MAILVEHVHLQVAEVTAEGDVLRLVDLLGGEDEQHMAVERSLDFLDIVKRARQIDAAHFRAHDRAERPYFHTSRATSTTSSSFRLVSSCVTVCPEPPPLEKPHCGDRPS